MASIPTAMHVVGTSTKALGSRALANKQASHTMDNVIDAGHFELIIYSITLFPQPCCRSFGNAGICVVIVGGVNSHRHASRVHFNDGPRISCFGREAGV